MNNPLFYIWEVSSQKQEIRDQALEKARNFADIKILFVGKREEHRFIGQNDHNPWVFIYATMNNERPASDIVGCKQWPDSAEHTELVQLSATATMKMV